MKPFKKILFPVDLSDVSPKIAPWVIMVAEKFEAQICLFFVVRELGQYASFSVVPGVIEEFEAKIIKGAETKMEEFAKTNLKEYPHFETKVVSGDPAQEILDFISAEEIDLVIMGTHGRTGIEHVFFGSVAEKVLRHSPFRIFVIPSREKIEQS